MPEIRKCSPRMDRILVWPLHKQVCVVASIFVLFLFAGWLFVYLSLGNDILPGDGNMTSFWSVFLPMIDPGHIMLAVQSNKPVLHILIPALSIVGFLLLGGFFVAGLVGVRDERTRLSREGKKRYHLPKKGGHAVILGWDGTVPGLIAKSVENPEISATVVMSMTNTETMRRGLSEANIRCPNNLYLYNGNYGDAFELDALSLDGASVLHIVGDDGDASRDSRNMEAAMNALAVVEHAGGRRGLPPLPCFLHMNDPYIYSTFQTMDFFGENERRILDVRPFNFFEQWARSLWGWGYETSPKYPPLAYDPARLREGATVHLAIAGFGRMGTALALEASRICHYSNGGKTKITVIDENMEELKERFSGFFSVKFGSGNTTGRAGKNGNHGGIHDVEFDFIPKRLESAEAREFLRRLARDENSIPTIAICFSDMDTSLMAALSLPVEVKKSGMPILVRQQSYSGLDEMVERLNRSSNTENARLWKNFRFFGDFGGSCGDCGRNERLAMLLNATYSVFSVPENFELATDGATRIDSHFWDSQESKFKWSSRHAADAVCERIRSLGFEPCFKGVIFEENVQCGPFAPTGIPDGVSESRALFGAKAVLESVLKNTAGTLLAGGFRSERLAASEHDRWWAERVLAGWKHAKKTSKPDLEHENMVAYENLDAPTKEKDRHIVRLSPWLLSSVLGAEFRRMPETETLARMLCASLGVRSNMPADVPRTDIPMFEPNDIGCFPESVEEEDRRRYRNLASTILGRYFEKTRGEHDARPLVRFDETEKDFQRLFFERLGAASTNGNGVVESMAERLRVDGACESCLKIMLDADANRRTALAGFDRGAALTAALFLFASGFETLPGR